MDELELERYKRHFILPSWGIEQQQRLKKIKCFVAGAGGTGSPTITMLALMGVGKIVICDCDVFEESNKNRQFIHSLGDDRLGMNKAESAALTVKSINPNVEVVYFSEKFDESNIDSMVGDCDCIFDCVDSFKYKFVLADCAMRKNIPDFFYGIMGYNTFGYIFYPPKTACFHCMFDQRKVALTEKISVKKSPVAVTAPTLFTAAGLMVSQALKFVVEYDSPLWNTVFFTFSKQSGLLSDKGVRAFKFWNSNYFDRVCHEQGFDWKTKDTASLLETVHFERNPDCPFCSGMCSAE